MEPFTNFGLPSWASEELAAVQRLLEEELPAGLAPFLDRTGHGLPEDASVPLRPLLVLAVARHYGFRDERKIRLAAAVHMIHLASILHDRLGKPALAASAASVEDPDDAHRREATDILLGDFLFAKASRIVVEDGDVAIIEDMIRTSARSAEARARVLALSEGEGNPDPRVCFDACSEKVTLLLSLCARIGAVLGNAPLGEKDRLSEYAQFLGRALRILEDVRFWQGEPSGLALPAYERALTHPMLLCWEREGLDAWREMSRILRSSAPGEGYGAVCLRLAAGGYLDASIKEARRWEADAVLSLDGLAATVERDLLIRLARSLVSGAGSGERERSP
jgi:geranylgeranyl pyrophosphate synthase